MYLFIPHYTYPVIFRYHAPHDFDENYKKSVEYIKSYEGINLMNIHSVRLITLLFKII